MQSNLQIVGSLAGDQLTQELFTIGQAFEESYQTKYKQTLHDQITSLENVAQFVRETGDLYGDVTSQVMSAMRN